MCILWSQLTVLDDHTLVYATLSARVVSQQRSQLLPIKPNIKNGTNEIIKFIQIVKMAFRNGNHGLIL